MTISISEFSLIWAGTGVPGSTTASPDGVPPGRQFEVYLKEQNGQGQRNEFDLVATGEAAIPALHAAALDPGRFATVRLRNMISSWSEIVATPENLNQAASVVHGALNHYDLPDLIELAGAEIVRLEAPFDVMGNAVE